MLEGPPRTENVVNCWDWIGLNTSPRVFSRNGSWKMLDSVEPHIAPEDGEKQICIRTLIRTETGNLSEANFDQKSKNDWTKVCITFFQLLFTFRVCPPDEVGSKTFRYQIRYMIFFVQHAFNNLVHYFFETWILKLQARQNVVIYGVSSVKSNWIFGSLKH